MSGLGGKTALVTGATSGIGRAVAERLAGEGAQVILSGRDAGRGEQVVAAIRSSGGSARFVRADLAELQDVRGLAAESGDADILVNNAGVFPFGPTSETGEETFDLAFDVNVKAPFFLTAAIAPQMLARGVGRANSSVEGSWPRDCPWRLGGRSARHRQCGPVGARRPELPVAGRIGRGRGLWDCGSATSRRTTLYRSTRRTRPAQFEAGPWNGHHRPRHRTGRSADGRRSPQVTSTGAVLE